MLSAKYFEALKAPRKQLVWFERSAHLPNIEEKDKFNEFLIRTALPTLPEQVRIGPNLCEVVFVLPCHAAGR